MLLPAFRPRPLATQVGLALDSQGLQGAWGRGSLPARGGAF